MVLRSSGVSKTYIRDRLTAKLGVSANQNGVMARVYTNYALSESESVKKLLIDNESSLFKKKIINFAYKHKNTIKKLPFIGNKALGIKNRYVKKALSDKL